MADEPERDDEEQPVEISQPFGVDALWEPPRRECRVVALDEDGQEVPLPQRSIEELLSSRRGGGGTTTRTDPSASPRRPENDS